MPVVPEPAKGSMTSPPGGVTSRTSQRISAIGFTVGWALRPSSPALRSTLDAFAT
jgi:hypothetical protein